MYIKAPLYRIILKKRKDRRGKKSYKRELENLTDDKLIDRILKG